MKYLQVKECLRLTGRKLLDYLRQKSIRWSYLTLKIYTWHSSPAKRRDFLDGLISQVDPEYHGIVLRYGRALRQRGNLLKDENCKPEAVFPWDKILADLAEKIVAGRVSLLQQINNLVSELYGQIAGVDSTIELSYKNSLGREYRATHFLRELEKNYTKDKFLGRTTVGPHLDDVQFRFNGASMVLTASRGEVRSVMLALKFIEAGLIFDFTGKKPVVLLDDIFSELDETRQRRLVDEFRDNQVIITSVSAPPGLKPDVEL